MTYSNPVLPGFYSDPSVCRVGEDYYLATSSFEYFPGVPLFHSRDLVNWRQIGHALTRLSQLDVRTARTSGGIFAPTLRHHDGLFYLITTDVSGIGNFIVTAMDPAGEWSDPVKVPVDGIDPSLLFHEGRVWYTGSAYGQLGVQLVEIDVRTGKLLSEPRFIWKGTGGKYPEGPHLYVRDGWFYLLIAEGGTEFGHMVTMARSRQIDGPYESCPHNPILTHRSMDHPLQSVGHSDLVQHTDGTWWMIFHGVRHQGYPPMHHMGRETCLTPIEWPEGEWPSVPQGNFLPLELTAPSDAAAQSKHTEIERADFSSGQLDLSWNFRRNPLDDVWSLTRVPGALSLRCAASTLDDKSPLAWVGRRQTLLSAQVETELHFDPQENGEQAGLSVMMNERYYATLGLLCENGERVVRLTQKFGDVTVERASVIMPEAQSLRLRIVGDPSLYHFQIWKGETWHELQTVETRHLSTELAGGFTGVYWGMFATGHGVDRQRWAEFRSFNVEALNSQ